MYLPAMMSNQLVTVVAGSYDTAGETVSGYSSDDTILGWVPGTGLIYNGLVGAREVDSLINYVNPDANRSELWLTLRADVPQNFFSSLSMQVDADTWVKLKSSEAMYFFKVGTANYSTWVWGEIDPGSIMAANMSYSFAFRY